MNSKTLTYISIGMILTVGLFVGSTMISKPVIKDAPVFMGEELVVTKTVAKPMVNTKAQAKVIPAPMPQSKIVTPLPIVPPTVSYSVLPKYPISALEQDLEGVTILSVYIGMAGKPERVEVKQSAGLAEFDESAKAAVSQWSFSPASQGGNAIASLFEIPVAFKISED
ncbi:MAG: energy transducer TonB [Candidatus Margulisiibacteriota bacterium]|nr:energy transducer TonB [Candidatus Margulisiibacteriota bacterium]